MDFPQEIELWYVIPAIRKALVVELKKHGMKQKDIAPALGVTPSAVSQYQKDKRASTCMEAFTTEPLKSEIEHSAAAILKDRSNGTAMREINRICAFMREKKLLCEIHRKKDPSLSKCDICYGQNNKS
jgi:predicted transcriptional regulator